VLAWALLQLGLVPETVPHLRSKNRNLNIDCVVPGLPLCVEILR